jgi:hypothetical protein
MTDRKDTRVLTSARHGPALEMTARDRWNGCRWRRDGTGHYESWFCRGNDASGTRAFWIRSTIFEPRGRPEAAVGERWAIVFDRERGEIVAVKSVAPAAECSFAEHGLSVRIGEGVLDDDGLSGRASSGGHAIAWDLAVRGVEPPLLLLPEHLYGTRLPRAKALVGRPLARFSGTLSVDDRTIAIDDWIGSVNHNWGSKHTDHYAWGQVAGFHEAPEAFLECSTARLRIGPLWTPFLSPAVLRIDGRELRFNALLRSARAKGRFDLFDWTLHTGDREARLRVRISAAREDFVALRYDNPPGGSKTCLNCKLARCEVELEERGRTARRLTSDRAAFEILSDDDHGFPKAC